MNMLVLASGFAAVGLALLVGIFIVSLGLGLFSRFTSAIDEKAELARGNLAVAAVLVGFLLSLAYLLKGTVKPMTQLLFRFFAAGEWELREALLRTAVLLAQFGGALLVALASLGLGVWLFARITRGLDEWRLIREGNLAVGLLLAGMTFSLSLVLGEGLDRLLQVLLTSPELANPNLRPFG